MRQWFAQWFVPLVLASFAGAALAESEKPPQAAPCPAALPADTRCLNGRDSAGAGYWIALPAGWKNGVLVLHAHGGPELGEPKLERSAEDLTRWAVVVKAGYAWAGSTYRQGGFAVRAAAEDTERLRRIFIEHVGLPQRTILHGQSWGAGVAAKAAEMFTATSDAKRPYDGVLLTSGVLGGATRSYDFRLDLRVVYQAVCGNHPKPDEPQYPLWQGLPLGAPLTRAELAARVDDCTGIRKKPEERSDEQRRRLETLLKVVRIPESSLLGHLNRATWDFQDIVFKRLDGANPFGNEGAVYSGSADDAALNAKVARYRADPAAVARLAADADLTGQIAVPVLTVHAIHDPVAFVELESAFHETMQSAHGGARLVQVFTSEAEHSYLSDPEYPALLEALMVWLDRGERPSTRSVEQRCLRAEKAFGKGCRFVDYQPAPLESRVTPRRR
ncbi:MAG TPA: hypothetical protein VKI18_05405 [Albitalea sp.]|nr:hypothetical protein [Albitalea sp.]